MIRLGDYCCQGGDKVLNPKAFSLIDVIVQTEGRRELIFSPLGNRPANPKLAIVGITPGAQSEQFLQQIKYRPVEVAAKNAAFAGAHKVIRELLSAHGLLDALKVRCTADVNQSDDILTTSLVKCCLRVDGVYKYAAPDIAASTAASFCATNRFLRDVLAYPSLQHVIIFGAPGWEAVSTLRTDTRTLLETLQSSGLIVLNLPHFAQNFQQRKLYALRPEDDERYFREKPRDRSYWSKANAMRTRTIAEVKRLTTR